MYSNGSTARQGYLVIGRRTVRTSSLGGAVWAVDVEPRSIERARAEIAAGAPAWPFQWDRRKPSRR